MSPASTVTSGPCRNCSSGRASIFPVAASLALMTASRAVAAFGPAPVAYTCRAAASLDTSSTSSWRARTASTWAANPASPRRSSATPDLPSRSPSRTATCASTNIAAV